jgi:Fe-S cluster assembly iron-binding protein IscA
LGLALEEPNDQDEKITVNGVEVRLEKRAAAFAYDSVVDYVDSAWGQGFTIRPDNGGCC